MDLQALSWDKTLSEACYMLHSTASTSVHSTSTPTFTCPIKQVHQDSASSVQEALELLEPRARKKRKKRRQVNSSPESVFVDETINALISGTHSQYFSREGSDVICTMPNGSKCKVLPSKTIDFEDASNFQTLVDWQPLDAMLETTDEAQERADALASIAPVPKQSVYTEVEMERALTFAKETKLFPPQIELKSDFHIDFLYRHFCRNARSERVKCANASLWKEAIRENLDVLDDSIGLMKCGPFSFDLVPGAKPVKVKSYPLSPVKKDALTKMIDILIANDILEESSSAEWNSPLLLVSKGDGRWRLVIDYRKVNLLIANEAVVYPRPEDLFTTVQDAFFMFLIDGRDFYFQREIDPHLRPVTTFQTHILAYQWKRMPQGLKPSSAAAINPVTNLLKSALHVWALLHCDDFLAWSSTEELSVKRFKWTLQKFREFGMTLGWFKVWILLDKAEYVSHVIDRGRVYPSPKMVEAIDGIQPPKSVKNVQTFVGMCGYFALYVPMLAEFRATLTDLTKKEVVWSDDTWNETHQHAFQMIKDLLKKACVYIIDWSLPVILVTDASGHAIGGCLMQKDREGFYRPLQFMSRSLDRLERMQENREREMRAGLYCMIKCNSVLAHNLFTWVTDHKNITFVQNAKSENMRIGRLALWLSMYWYNIQHSAGDSLLIQIADALSRLDIVMSSDDNDIFMPFQEEVVQNILLSAITDEIILSPARFSTNTDTYARLDRSTVEVVPNSLAAIRHSGSCQCDGCVTSIEVVDDARPSPIPSERLTIASVQEQDRTFYALDLFSGLGTVTAAIQAAGYTLCAAVERNVRLKRETLQVAEQATVFSELQGLTDAIAEKVISMPQISLVHSNIAPSPPTVSQVAVNDGVMPRSKLASTLRLVQSLNATQKLPVQHVVLSFLSRSLSSSLDPHKDLISAMGYALSSQVIHTSRNGSPVASSIVVAVMSIGESLFPVVLPDDQCVPAFTRLASQSTRGLSAIVSGPSLPRPRHVPIHTGQVLPIVQNGDGVHYSSNHCIPRITATLPHVVLNPTAPSDQWKSRRVTRREACSMYDLHDNTTEALSSLSDTEFCSVLAATIPTCSLQRVFTAARRLSKVGGAHTGWTERPPIVYASVLTETGSSSGDVHSSYDLVMPINNARVTVPRASSQDTHSTQPCMYEFFSGTSVLGRTFDQHGWTAHTIDLIKPRHSDAHPTLTLDINAMSRDDLRAMFRKHGVPVYIHCAPPCGPRSREHPRGKHYNVVDGRYRACSPMAKMADASVAQCFIIIEVAKEFNKFVLFTFENPNYRCFKQLPGVCDMVDSNQVNYLHLNDYDYMHFSQKPSCWLKNFEWESRRITNTPNRISNQFGRHNSRQRNTYPQELCDEVMRAVTKAFNSNPLIQEVVAAITRRGDRRRTRDSDTSNTAEATSGSSVAGPSRGSDSQTRSRFSRDTRVLRDENDYFISEDDVAEAQANDPFIKLCKTACDLREELEHLKDQARGDGAPNLDAVIAEKQKAYHESIEKKFKIKHDRGNVLHMYKDDNGIIVYGMANKHWPVPVINSELGAKVIDLAHDSLLNMHLGQRKMLYWVRERYWWKQMRVEIRDHTKTCRTCQKMKFTSSPGYGFMQMKAYERPGKQICVDIVVLGHKTAKGTSFIFTILDTFSHYSDAYCMSDSEAETCANCLLQWCQYNGMPEVVLSDRGLNLNLSEVFKELYILLGIDSSVTHPYAPQGNMVERFHRWLGAALRILYFEQDLDVDQSLPFVLWIFRGTENRTTGFTPFFLHLGREVRFPLDVFDSSAAHLTPHEYASHIKEQMQTVWKTARIAQEIAQEESARYYNEAHGRFHRIEVGSQVLRSKLPRNPGDVSTHILPRCSGPYKVLRIDAMGAELEHNVTNERVRCSLRQIKPLHVRLGFNQDDEPEQSEEYASGQLVIVKLHVSREHHRKWQVVVLLHCNLDRTAWEIQWYNSRSNDARPMLEQQYYPAWAKPDGQEAYERQPGAGWEPLQWNVYNRRIISPPFQLVDQKLPANIRALIRAHPVSRPI